MKKSKVIKDKNMRSIWSGSLTFGLVNIPVRLYSATAGEQLEFNMLHKKDYSPIRYAKICRKEGKEIPFDEIVKGYEYQKGDFIVLSDADFKKVNIKKTKSINVMDFVREEEIDPMYFEKPYYLEPDKGADRAYALLREALTKTKKVGIAKFVIRNREHLGLIKPGVKGVLVLDQMRFVDELHKAEELNLPDSESVSKKELDMAIKFIDQLSSHFTPSDYKDTYKEELKEVIEDKAKGKPVHVEGEEPAPTKVADLMDTLKASLEKARSQPQSFAN